MIERMYSIKETAEVLRKSPKTVRRYVHQGILSVLRSGPRSVVIPETELKRFMMPDDSTEEQRLFKLVDEELAKTRKPINQLYQYKSS